MQCVILRNCYVDRYYEKGEVYEVPDAMVKLHPKNFRKVGVSEDEAEEALNAEYERKRIAALKSFWCSECKRYHSEEPVAKTGKMSKIAKAHKKYEIKDKVAE